MRPDVIIERTEETTTYRILIIPDLEYYLTEPPRSIKEKHV
jgi:hypothetical protein